jgi:putative FmdB family regulatory protein
MPIYEYECTKCGRVAETLQKFSDKPLKKCRHCSGKLNKLVSQSSFQLKGTGWYVTDYANRSKDSSPNPEKKHSDPSSKPEKKAASGKTDSTPKTSKKAAD